VKTGTHCVSKVKPCGILLIDLKEKLYKNGWEEKKLCQLKSRILEFFGEFEVVIIQTLMRGVKSRIDLIQRNDIIGNDHK